MYLFRAFLALLTERITGYPDWVYRAIGHPVTWIGRLIAGLDNRWNREDDDFTRRRQCGIAALVILLTLVVTITLLFQNLLLALPFGFLLLVVTSATLPAQQRLERHVEAVATALETGVLEAGRPAGSLTRSEDS